MNNTGSANETGRFEVGMAACGEVVGKKAADQL